LSAVPTVTGDYSTEVERCSDIRIMLHGWRCLGLYKENQNQNEKNNARLEGSAVVPNAM